MFDNIQYEFEYFISNVTIEIQNTIFYLPRTLVVKIPGVVPIILGINFIRSKGVLYISKGTVTLFPRATNIVAKIEQSEDSIADILEEARRDWTIGINPAINWERNNIKEKIDLINPDITIITSTIKPCPLDMEEFNTQIK